MDLRVIFPRFLVPVGPSTGPTGRLPRCGEAVDKAKAKIDEMKEKKEA